MHAQRVPQSFVARTGNTGVVSEVQDEFGKSRPNMDCAEFARARARYGEMARQTAPALLGVARRLCELREDEAQDLVQEALVRGYEGYVRGQFTDGTNARAWLMRILYNAFLNAEKRRRKWDSGLDALSGDGANVPAAMHSPPSTRPDAALMSTTLDEPVENALQSLSADMRVCVVLVDMEGWEYAEAAAALGIPVGTVRSRLYRARLSLYSSLYEYGRDRRRV